MGVYKEDKTTQRAVSELQLIKIAQIEVDQIMGANSTNATEEELELWLRIFHGIVGSTLLLCSIIGSCAVLLLITCNQTLRYPSMVVSLGLVVADLVIAVAWIFQVLVLAAVGEWPLADGVCTAFGAVLVWLLYVRWSEVAIVTADRFLIVIFPFFTYQKCSKPLMVVMTLLAWIVPAALTLPSVKGFGRYTFRLQISACTVDCEGDGPCTAFYTALYGVFLVVGGVLPAVLYTTMYCTGVVKRWKYKNRKLGTVASDSSTAATNPTQEPHSSSSTSSGYATEANTDGPGFNSDAPRGNETGDQSRQKSRRLSKFRFLKPRERRALMTIFIIFISMLITHIPIYVLSSIRSVGDIYESTPLIVHLISTYIFIVGPILDSVIIMRNKDCRDVVRKSFKRRTVRTMVGYNTGRRPSVMLLLGTTGYRQNGSTSAKVHTSSFSASEGGTPTHLANGETRQGNGMDIISHSLYVDRRPSIDDSCYKYVSDV